MTKMIAFVLVVGGCASTGSTTSGAPASQPTDRQREIAAYNERLAALNRRELELTALDDDLYLRCSKKSRVPKEDFDATEFAANCVMPRDGIGVQLRALRAERERTLAEYTALVQQEKDEMASRPAPAPPAWAVFLGALGHGMASQPTTTQPAFRPINQQNQAVTQAMQPQPNIESCMSDFACGMGRTCVKKNFHGDGVCAKAVDQYGVQDFSGPRTDSIFVKVPGPHDCPSVMCPAGFRCDMGSGSCVK